MQFEAVTLDLRLFPAFGNPVVYPVAFPPLFVEHGNYCAVHKADVHAQAETLDAHEDNLVKELAGHEFHNTRVRRCIGKTARPMALDEEQVMVLEIAKKNRHGSTAGWS